MKAQEPETKIRKLFAIVASGITGIIVLNGLCVLLHIMGVIYRPPFVVWLYTHTTGRWSLGQTFAYIGLIGFALGVIFWRRFLTCKTEAALATVFSLLLIIGAWQIHLIGQNYPIPYNVKLADCTNGVTTIQLKVPRGHDYVFSLSTPDASYKCSGRIQIFQGATNIGDLSLSPDIEGRGLAGRDSQGVIKQPGDFFQPKQDYTIQITLDPPPPPTSSFWLYCLRPMGDTQK